MSARASGYIKALTVCPNGEMISAREKLVALVLADSHQDRAKRFTYPSVETIAEESRCDKRNCQRYLQALERKGVICRIRPPRQGSGMITLYFFPELDEMPEGWQDAALFESSFFAQKRMEMELQYLAMHTEKGVKRASEGRQKGGNLASRSIGTRAGTVTVTETNASTTPPNPLVTEGEGGRKEPDDAGTTETGAAQVEDELRNAVSIFRGNEGAPAVCGAVRKAASRRISARGAAGGTLVEHAVDQVCSALGIANHRMYSLLRCVISLAAEKGDPPASVALAMIAAWNKQNREGALLHRRFGLRKFFGEGIWRDENRWLWNEELLRQRAGASAGSYG